MDIACLRRNLTVASEGAEALVFACGDEATSIHGWRAKSIVADTVGIERNQDDAQKPTKETKRDQIHLLCAHKKHWVSGRSR
jgi:hypothetical protein